MKPIKILQLTFFLLFIAVACTKNDIAKHAVTETTNTTTLNTDLLNEFFENSDEPVVPVNIRKPITT